MLLKSLTRSSSAPAHSRHCHLNSDHKFALWCIRIQNGIVDELLPEALGFELLDKFE